MKFSQMLKQSRVFLIFLGLFLASSANADSDFYGWSSAPGYHAGQSASAVLDKLQTMLGASNSRIRLSFDAVSGRLVYTAFASAKCSYSSSSAAGSLKCIYYQGEDWNGETIVKVTEEITARKINAGLQMLDGTTTQTSGDTVNVLNADAKITCSIPASDAAVAADSNTRCRFGAI